jgi:ribosomal subunit interface protein
MQEESMELHIEGQRIEVSDDLRTMIADRLEKLNAHHSDVIHARVSLVKSNHHQHGSDEARIILSMTRRKVLQATKVGKTIEEAINSSLDALQHELSHYRGKRRELDKQRLKTAKLGPRLSGKVVQLVTDQGYGFIDIGADEDVRFTRQVVMAGAFERLTEGMSVEVDVMEGSEGYEATRVVPLQADAVRTS